MPQLPNGLTLKQERFCLEFHKTGNATGAYRTAYSSENMAIPTINRNAAAMFENSKITTRIAELRAKDETKALITRRQALMLLAQIANGKDDDSRAKKVEALKLLGKWEGWEAPTRTQLEHAFRSPFDKFMDGADSDSATKEAEPEIDAE